MGTKFLMKYYQRIYTGLKSNLLNKRGTIRNTQSYQRGALCKIQSMLKVDGLIEVGGRTERWVEATWNKQKFILLPSDHKVLELIIRYEHDKTGHLGIAATIAMIRSKYWIIKIKSIMRTLSFIFTIIRL